MAQVSIESGCQTLNPKEEGNRREETRVCVRAGPKLVSIAILTLIGLHQNAHSLDWYFPRRVLSTDSAIKPVRPVSQPFRRVGNQTAVLSKLRFQVPNPSAKVRHGKPLAPPQRFRCPFQFGNARLNIFNLDGLGCVRHYGFLETSGNVQRILVSCRVAP